MENEILIMTFLNICWIRADGYMRSELGYNYIKYCTQHIVVRQLRHRPNIKQSRVRFVASWGVLLSKHNDDVSYWQCGLQASPKAASCTLYMQEF